MKKILFMIILLILIAGGYFGYKYYKELSKPKFIYHDLLEKVGDNEVNINSFTIYGKYLNFKGELPTLSDEYELVFKNNDDELVIKSLDGTFNTSEYINDGINLENLQTGDYIMLLHNKTSDEYYNLINTTDYHDNKYYTMTKNNKNNLITFKEDEYLEKKYWLISIQAVTLPDDVYDVVIDPGHGGIDTGASNGKYHESKYTLDYAKTLKDVLEDEGLKVKLTREDDTNIAKYGAGSRTGIPYETKAKLMLSIHLNSSNSKSQSGVEIYRAYQANNNFAKTLADNLVELTDRNYSINPQNRVFEGVYTRVYSKSDIDSLIKEAKRDGYEPYDFDNDLTYYYFIRETGGIMTKAFSDGRNPKLGENIYRNSNQGTEAYLCELAYISNSNDLRSVINNKEDYIKALKTSVLSYVKGE